MLKRSLIAGALLCAPISAHAGNYWEEQFGRSPSPSVSPSQARARHSHRSARVHLAIVPGARGAALSGVYAPLAAKAMEIVHTCGSRVSSGVRHTYVAGTHRMSLHASGHAVDLVGNPGCIYHALAGWPGGFSTDYSAVHHVHVSLGGREDGHRFAHNRYTRTRYASRRHKHAG